MLEATNIRYTVGKKALVEDFSAVFRAGKLNLIIGPNGAGKSTLIKLLSRQTKPHSGKVAYSGIDIAAKSEKELAQYRAVLSQNIELAFPLKVHQVVMMGRYPHFSNRPERTDYRICEEVMRYFSVWEMAEREYMTLSGGEKQRVHFARVLAQIWQPQDQPRFLFLDEPLTFLDIKYQLSFMTQIQEFIRQQDVVCVGVVHDLNLAARFGDELFLINEGKLFTSGAVEEVITPETIRQAFGVDIHTSSDNGHLAIHFVV